MNAHTVASSSRVASSLAGTAEPVAPRQLYRFAHVTRPDKLATVLAADGLRLGELVPQQTLFRAVDATTAADAPDAASQRPRRPRWTRPARRPWRWRQQRPRNRRWGKQVWRLRRPSRT